MIRFGWKKPLLVTLLAVSLVVVLAGWRRHHHGPPDAARIQHIREKVADRLTDALEDLNASEEQIAVITAVKDRVFEGGVKLVLANYGAKQELLAQWDADTPDARKVHALIDQRVDALRVLLHDAANAALEVHGTLSPEQRAYLNTEILKRK